MSPNMIRLLRFAIRYRNGWHTYGTDRSTAIAVYALGNHGLLEVNRETRQFMLIPAGGPEYGENPPAQ